MVLALASCRSKVIRRDLILDVTKPYKIPFFGKEGEKFGVNIKGQFVGQIKVGAVAYGNILTEGNFSVYQDSINLNMGFTNIYQDDDGVTWYIRPVNASANKGTVTFSLTEVRW